MSYSRVVSGPGMRAATAGSFELRRSKVIGGGRDDQCGPRAIAKSAFRGLTCSDGKQEAESDHPSHRSGGPPAWRAVDGSEVRARVPQLVTSLVTVSRRTSRSQCREPSREARQRESAW